MTTSPRKVEAGRTLKEHLAESKCCELLCQVLFVSLVCGNIWHDIFCTKQYRSGVVLKTKCVAKTWDAAVYLWKFKGSIYGHNVEFKA